VNFTLPRAGWRFLFLLEQTQMNQNILNRAVARATGETVAEISRRGFQPLTSIPHESEPDDAALDLYLDWDEIELRRNTPVVEQPPRQAVA
jgi:hypothetical protein